MSTAPISRDRELAWIPTDSIIKNENNPRKEPSFTPEQLESLRHSINTHGVLQPVLVEPYDQDMYLLIEGERRWWSAKLEGIQELPAIVVNRMSEHDEVVVMFNIHTQHKGWEMAEELAAIRNLKSKNGHLSDEELATELGMSVATLRDRLRVLGMGEAVVVEIGKGKIEYSAALRANQAANRIARTRPQLATKLGGPKAIEGQLLRKAKQRPRGISQELVQYKDELGDPRSMPDEVVEEYLVDPQRTMGEVLHRHRSVEQQIRMDELAQKVRRLEREIRAFTVERAARETLRELRRALGELIETAQMLEGKVTEALRG